MHPQIAYPAPRVGNAARPALPVAGLALGETPARVAQRKKIRIRSLIFISFSRENRR
jgi:hypothetical protein